LLNLPENARLGTAFADVSFFAGDRAGELAKGLNADSFEDVWADSGFVNAKLTEKALLSLYEGLRFGNAAISPEEMTEEELFSPVMYAYLAILPWAGAKSAIARPELKGERRRLFLRLAAAFYGGFSPSEELSLCEKVMDEARAPFLTSGEDEGLKMLCFAALAVLEKRINGGF